ncbi:MAG: PilZ domain-containing protein [Acidobacteriota bacterium]
MSENSQHSASAASPQRPVARLGLAFDDFRSFITYYAPHIAMGGMFVGARTPLEPGSICQLDFKLKDGFQLIQGLGEVVWTREQPEGPDRPPGMGIRFRELDDTSRDLVFHIVERRLAQGESLAGQSDREEQDLEALVRSAGQRRQQAEARAAEEANLQEEPTRHLSRSELDAAMHLPSTTGSAMTHPAPAAPADRRSEDELLPSLPEDVGAPRDSAPATLPPEASSGGQDSASTPFSGARRGAAATEAEAATQQEPLAGDFDAAAAAWNSPLEGEPPASGRLAGGSRSDSAVNLEDLFKVAPTAESPSLNPAMTPSRPTPPRTRRSRAPLYILLGVLLLLAATVGVLLWWMNQPAAPAPPVRELPRTAGRAEPTLVDVGEASAEPEEEVATPVETAPPPPPPPPPPAAEPAAAVQEITWRDLGGETLITVRGDGAFLEDRRTVSRLRGGNPRLLVVLKGISRPFRPPQLSVATDQVAGLRTGLHVKTGGEELHLVVDLQDPAAELLRSEASERELRLWVGTR